MHIGFPDSLSVMGRWLLPTTRPQRKYFLRNCDNSAGGSHKCKMPLLRWNIHEDPVDSGPDTRLNFLGCSTSSKSSSSSAESSSEALSESQASEDNTDSTSQEEGTTTLISSFTSMSSSVFGFVWSTSMTSSPATAAAERSK